MSEMYLYDGRIGAPAFDPDLIESVFGRKDEGIFFTYFNGWTTIFFPDTGECKPEKKRDVLEGIIDKMRCNANVLYVDIHIMHPKIDLEKKYLGVGYESPYPFDECMMLTNIAEKYYRIIR